MNISIDRLLPEIYASAIDLLQQFVTRTNFLDQLRISFGDRFDPDIAIDIHHSLLAGDLNFLPPIEIRTSEELAGANGAYDRTRDRIFIAQDFLIESLDRPDLLLNLLLEEIGHKFDRLLNGDVDSAGDEGAIFAAIVQGQILSSDTLAQLRVEDDHQVLIIDGQLVAVEMETWTGSNGNDIHTGTSDEDILNGLAGNDTINGIDGDDTIDGGSGNDILLGGNGNDRLTGNAGTDYLDGGAGDDDLGGIAPQVASSPQISTDGDIYIGGDGFDRAVLRSDPNGITINYSDINNGNISGGGSIKEVEYVFIYGHNGTDIVNLSAATSRMDAGGGDDILIGGDGNDILIGGAGNDTMTGGNGDDVYDIDSLGDIIIENANGGIDYVNSSISYTLPNNVEFLTLTGTNNFNGTGNNLDNAVYGNSGNNILTGGAGNDFLNGRAGIDTLIGGIGDDIYDVDNLEDLILENTNQGIELVYASVSGYTLGANVERLQLYGTATSGNGNSLDNALYGNLLDDTLNGGAGNDFLNGGAGIDTLIGGIGDDIYDVDNLDDVIVENANQGIELVYASISGYTLGANVERLQLYGTATSGNGNSLDNALYGNLLDDTLNGGAGNDFLNGGAGIDTLIGGIGDDIYDLDNLDDLIVENANQGIELVYASVSGYTLGANVERLQLYGTATSGNGNSLDNALYGNLLDDTLNGGAGNDTLVGGGGNDILTGGIGNDIFVFSNNGYTTLATLGIDSIADFSVGQDKIELSKSIFSNLTTNSGILGQSEFNVVTSDAAAAISSAAIVYNQTNGKLFYNADLTAPGLGTNGGQFAQLATGLVLTNNQFEAIG